MRLYNILVTIQKQDGTVIVFVIKQITEIVQPVAGVVKARGLGQGIFHGDMQMGEDEEVHLFLLENLAGILDLEFVFVTENEDLRFMGGAAGGGEMARDGKSVARVQHAVQHAIGLVSKNAFYKIITPLLAAQTVAMAHQTAFAVNQKGFRLIKHLATKLLREVILHPHVVIAGEKIDLNTFLMEFIKKVKETEVTFGGHIAVFKPKVEHVAQEEKMLERGFMMLNHLYQ